MRRAELLQEVRKMRFEEAYGGWQGRRLPAKAGERLPWDSSMPASRGPGMGLENSRCPDAFALPPSAAARCASRGCGSRAISR